MNKSTPYNFSLLDPSLTNTFPTFAPTGLAGSNSNYSGLMPGGSSSGFGSGFDLNQISSLDPMAQVFAINAYTNDPKRQAEMVMGLLPGLEAFYDRRAEKAQRLGLQSNLWGAAIDSVRKLPEIIAQGVGQVRDARLAGQQAILNQAQRPYNIGGFSMPYNTYRI